MTVPPIVEYAAIAVALIISACAVYAIVQIRRTLKQQQKFMGAIAAVEEFQKLQREFGQFLGRMESDSRELQKIALQIESAVAAVNDGIHTATTSAADRQRAAIESLRDYMDAQEQRLATVVESVSGGLRAFPRQTETPAPDRHGNGDDHSRLRRETLRQHPELRFAVLKEWLSINALGIQRRASRSWKTARDLIAGVPEYLEPVAEVLDDCILLIGTRQVDEKLAILFRELDSSSQYRQWFEQPLQGQHSMHTPAVLTGSQGHLKLVAKGTNAPSLIH